MRWCHWQQRPCGAYCWPQLGWLDWQQWAIVASQANLTAASNTLRTAFVANDTTASNGLVTLLVANDTTTSNGVVTLLVANDTTTSNALRTDIANLQGGTNGLN